MKKVKIGLIITVTIALAVIIIYMAIFSKKIENSDSIWFEDIIITEDKIELKGMMANSSKIYKGFKYRLEGEGLFINVYTAYIPLIGEVNSDEGVIDIKLNKGSKQINQIFLVGKNISDKKLIWNKN